MTSARAELSVTLRFSSRTISSGEEAAMYKTCKCIDVALSL